VGGQRGLPASHRRVATARGIRRATTLGNFVMNEHRLMPDDPRLTAYALGELEGDERAEVEAALRRDRDARRRVEEIRATVAQLEEALAEETELERNSADDGLA